MESAQFFEGLMLVLFGVSWPVAIAKTLKVRKVHGKSVIFLYCVAAGYVSGVVAKFIKAQGGWPDAVTALYALNAMMVCVEIVLYYCFRQPPDQPAADLQPESPGAELTQDNGRAT
jgi:hypothetical protein